MLRPRNLAWFVPIFLAGCNNHQPAVQLMDVELHEKLRSQYVLPAEPEFTVSLHELYDTLAGVSTDGEDAPSHPADEEFIIVGRVGGLDDPDNPDDPKARWTRNVAEFRLMDPAGDADDEESDDHGGHHHHDDPDHECPFCSSEGPGVQTIVRFVDENGELLPVDARVLFRLDGNDLVVVRGRAQLEPGTIVIHGTGIHVRR